MSSQNKAYSLDINTMSQSSQNRTTKQKARVLTDSFARRTSLGTSEAIFIFIIFFQHCLKFVSTQSLRNWYDMRGN